MKCLFAEDSHQLDMNVSGSKDIQEIAIHNEQPVRDNYFTEVKNQRQQQKFAQNP